MARELTLNASMEYLDADDLSENLSIEDFIANVATKSIQKITQTIGLVEEAILLGDVSAPAWCFLKNVAPTNFVNVKVGTAGAIFAKLRPGGFCLLELGSGAQAPYAIADTAACKIRVFIVSL